MSTAALEARDLRRVFPVRGKPHRVALDGLSLTVEAGRVHGLLGPNGAGKTTLCRIVATVLLPTAGTVEVLGHDVVADAGAVRRSIGIVFGGERGLYGRLTAAENLAFWCAMHRIPRRRARARIAELLDRFGLAERADVRVETFSRGMKQRLHLARGLVADPPLLLLDEPTVGMDPVAAHDFRRLIAELRGEGRTVLLTTHDMAEAEAVCDTLTFLDGGHILGSGTPATARSGLAEASRIQVHDLAPDVAAAVTARLAGIPGVQLVHGEDTPGTVTVTAATDSVGGVLTALVDAGHTSLSIGPPSLEQVYLNLLGRDQHGAPRGMSVR
jgi:ABC-2 type transport system ATP-binding protein